MRAAWAAAILFLVGCHNSVAIHIGANQYVPCREEKMANTVNITATVTDANNVVWAYAPWALNLVGYDGIHRAAIDTTGAPVTVHYSGVTDPTGAFSVTVTQNTAILPPNTRWLLTLWPTAAVRPSSVLFIAPQTASVDISAMLTQKLLPVWNPASWNVSGGPLLLRAQSESDALQQSNLYPNNIYYWTN